MKSSPFLVLGLGVLILAGGFYFFNFNASGENDFQGSTSVGLTILYEDGTEKLYDQKTSPLSIYLPLQISDSGGKISGLKVTVSVKPTFTGTYTATSLDDSWLTMVISSPIGGVDKNFKSYSGSAFSTQTFTSGEWATIFSEEFSASSIETTCGTYGIYSMSIKTGVYLNMVFGSTDNTKSASTTSTWGFQYEADPLLGSLSSISVSIGRSPLS